MDVLHACQATSASQIVNGISGQKKIPAQIAILVTLDARRVILVSYVVLPAVKTAQISSHVTIELYLNVWDPELQTVHLEYADAQKQMTSGGANLEYAYRFAPQVASETQQQWNANE